MKEELLKLLESMGLTIKFQGYWTGEEYVDTEFLEKADPEMLKLFDEDGVCEGASEEAITKAILGLLGYLSENERQFTVSNEPEPHVKWADGSDWGVAFVGYLELVG